MVTVKDEISGDHHELSSDSSPKEHRDLTKGLDSNEGDQVIPVFMSNKDDMQFRVIVLPVWCIGIFTYMAVFRIVAGSVLQKTVDPLISDVYFVFLFVAIWLIWIPLSRRFSIPLPSNYAVQQQFTLKMGFELLFTCVTLGIFSFGEIIYQGIVIRGIDGSNAVVGMLLGMLLVPQIFILIAVVVFNGIFVRAIHIREFYYSWYPENQSTFESTLVSLQGAFIVLIISNVRMSLKEDTESGEKTYLNLIWLLAGLSLLNFLWFAVCCWVWGPRHEARTGLQTRR
ncbi:hypothetical protein GIB67_000299 [Kingdonia uniflora]|uniref:Uncharacterized protein n=1 Tax=Kingdonia uniflora TaxID=39325 RepID=A0A7J7LC61_9MAGN|nr:hypothetical protein GIB67_000299 [Kingdonia uniflora]